MDPNNTTALHELELVHNLIHFDRILPTDATLKIERSIQILEPLEEAQKEGYLATAVNDEGKNSFCSLF